MKSYWLQEKFGFDIKYYLFNGSWSVGSEVVQAISGLAAASIFARWASQETFGQFQLVMSTIALTGVVSVKGLDSVLMRDISLGFDGVYRRALKVRFWWSLLGVPIMAALSGYYFFQGQENLGWAYALAVMLAPLHYTVGSWLNYVKGKKKFKKHALYVAIKSIANLFAVTIAIIGSNGNLLAVFSAHFVIHLVFDAIFLKSTLRSVENDKVSSDWKEYGYFISKAGLIKGIIASMDKILLGVMVSPTALAIYTVAIIIPNYVQLSVKAIFQTASPRLSHRDHISFKEVNLILVFGIISALATAVFVAILVEPVFGSNYKDAVAVGYVAAASMIFHPLAQYLVNYMYMSNNRRGVMMSNTWCPLIKIFLLMTVGLYGGVVGFAAVYTIMGMVWVLVPLMAMKINVQQQRIVS